MFWNNLSKTYKEKFNISPTLIFFGSEDDLKSANLSEDFGNIILEKEVNGISPWQYTWSLFYFTKFYKDEVCAIMGIDQIPLGTFFLKDSIENIPDENYVMLIDDQYTVEKKYPKKWDEGGFSPSAYHIAKGQTFCDIFNFEESFEKEIIKLNSLNIKTMWGDKWGLDEAYSSSKLNEFKYGIHLMRTEAAGTFAIICAFLGIPWGGYEGLDTQESLHQYRDMHYLG
jgi:hypothetical protein